MSYTRLFYHIVFRTYMSEPSIPETKKVEMQRFIYHLCQNHEWKLEQINMHLDHVHILMELPSKETLSKVVSLIKSETSKAFRANNNFPLFKGFGKGYGAFTVGYKEVEVVRDYIRNQSEHHRCDDSRSELMRLISENGIAVDDFFDKDW